MSDWGDGWQRVDARAALDERGANDSRVAMASEGESKSFLGGGEVSGEQRQRAEGAEAGDAVRAGPRPIPPLAPAARCACDWPCH